MDISEAIQPKSDQLNADDLVAGPETITITDVRPGNKDQPVNVYTDVYGEPRPWKPAVTMLRLMAAAWGKDTKEWHGKRVTLYRDPSVEWAGKAVGGIRICAMSGIDRAFTDSVTIKRGKKSDVRIEKLPDAPAPASSPDRRQQAITAFEQLGVNVEQLETHLGKPVDTWETTDLTELSSYYQTVKNGENS